MKNIFKSLALVAACAMFGSCMTVSNPVAATGNPVGSKCGVAKSSIYFGIWSADATENGIDKAAKSAGITKISHVDSYTTSYVLGIVKKQVTKVYGE